MVAVRTVQIVGHSDGRWLTWRWSARYPLGVAEIRKADAPLARLHAALPKDEQSLALEGDLTDRDTELTLMQELAAVLLPQSLLTQLIEAAASGDRLQVRIAPPPNAAAVPWGLLPVDEERRLLDIADVSWMAPILPRDLRHDAPSPMPWGTARSLPPLHVIDPFLPHRSRVLSEADRQDLGIANPSDMGRPWSADGLSRALGQPRSRLFLLGHCETPGSSGNMGFLLADDTGASPDPLTAHELMAEPEKWPMPPRVAVVACASGTDMLDLEPFGLAAAMLHNGADTVHATLWTLPTETALRADKSNATRAFLQLARGFEAAQLADDPVEALNAWQRLCLREWRNPASRGTSPLLWGAAMTITAPPRQLQE
ncbi:hypothetical protein FOJ82_13435 [Tessaracoccus rhinocerotis]|uniref:CHAT domain-containing protein n=1 Tax=Tessaracoccus rhinocerotis TaxID=1689449 RepID=A0A553JWR9_9ACTN|nr:hypothetical protein [Tessaracoccus rhinocerotis]TRY16870.1 hypothetical protein FOJ82_13435 [Tessaracoccus rhinocerotis]